MRTVRMRRPVPQYVQVMDLKAGEIYLLTDAHAEQFIAMGNADPVEAEMVVTRAERLEAAALQAARRRG